MDTTTEGLEQGMERDHVRKVFRAMLTARILENKLGSLYKAGKIVGGVYLGKGQEAVSSSLAACLEKGRDVYAPLIRDQAGRTAFGEPMLDCTRTYLGSVEGPMRGRDGNIHRGRPSEGMPAMISHLGTAISVVSGMLMAKRLKGQMDGVVGATCVGDGCTSTGSFHEGLNAAAVEKLPLVLTIANNQYAYSTPNDRQFVCDDLVDKAKGYGVRGHSADGTDMIACIKVMQEAVARARAGEGPQLVVASMLRLTGHGEHDDGSYVDPKLKTSGLGRDSIDVGKAQMLENGFTDAAELEAWEQEAAEVVQAAVATAQKEPGPDPYKDDWSAYSNPDLQTR
ncbi:MAG: thiamine pyrophosphate-dependent dehydrogenase E1 component subunit alpha [Akkermansiaceae bacterium]|jgi:TPP-dependent pyruvate/acetoin dehydrogenase alpha subunit|tara:strand:+ start:43305 stop:44321 length:1017 start_codon:yes stop_codon:yes gene_type:complete